MQAADYYNLEIRPAEYAERKVADQVIRHPKGTGHWTKGIHWEAKPVFSTDRPVFPRRTSALLVLGACLCILTLVFMGSGGLVSRPAYAATRIAMTSPLCQAEKCNGLDPYKSWCAGQQWDSWYVVASAYAFVQGSAIGYVQLWYSKTCGTNWSRWVCTNPSRCLTYSLDLYRECSDFSGCGIAVQYLRDATALTAITRQQYLPTTRAEATITTNCCPKWGYGSSTGFY
jgi:hypothetical protein